MFNLENKKTDENNGQNTNNDNLKSILNLGSSSQINSENDSVKTTKPVKVKKTNIQTIPNMNGRVNKECLVNNKTGEVIVYNSVKPKFDTTNLENAGSSSPIPSISQVKTWSRKTCAVVPGSTHGRIM